LFKFLRFFSIASAVAFIGMTVILLFIYRELGLEQVANEVERENVVISQAFTNALWPMFSDYVTVGAPRDGDKLRTKPETQGIHAAAKSLVSGLNVIKAKLYRLDGLTIYSSELSQIGKIKKNNQDFFESARNGNPASDFSFRPEFNGINGPLKDRHVVSTYIPIRGKSGKVEAIFELYSDVTKQVDVLSSDVKWLSVGLVWAFVILYGILFLIVRSADHTIKAQEKSLRKSEERLRGAIDSLQEGFALYDADDRLIAYNKIYEQVMPGLKEIMDRGGTFENVFRGIVAKGIIPEAKGREEEFIQERLEQHRNPKGPIIRNLPDGGWQRIEEVRTPEGGIALSVIDITELKQAEEELRKAHDGLESRVEQRTSELRQEMAERKKAEMELIHHKKMESLGSLAAGIAHNLNNLLQPILMLSHLTQKKLPEGSREHKNMTVIGEACNRAGDLVNQIATFSRSEELVAESINIYDIIREGLDLIYSVVPSSITVSEELDKDTGIVVADPAQTQTVLVNLVANALDAMKEKAGELKILLTHAHVNGSQEGFVAGLKPGDFAKLTVADTGHGMDKDTLSRVFDPFFTTKGVGMGTGLGLSSAFGIINKHGGTIHVTSKEGKGSTFDVYLPLEQDVSP